MLQIPQLPIVAAVAFSPFLLSAFAAALLTGGLFVYRARRSWMHRSLAITAAGLGTVLLIVAGLLFPQTIVLLGGALLAGGIALRRPVGVIPDRGLAIAARHGGAAMLLVVGALLVPGLLIYRVL